MTVHPEQALQAANPAAYSEEAAEAAEAAYRALAERAKLRLKRLQEEPTTEEAVERQLKLAVTVSHNAKRLCVIPRFSW